MGRFELGLNFGEMADLILSNLEIFGGLSRYLTDVFLFFVHFVENLILVSDFIIETVDGVVPVGLLLFELLDGNINILHILFDHRGFLFQKFLLCSGISSVLFHFNELLLRLLKLDLQISLLGGHLGLFLMILRHVALLSFKLLHQSFLLLFNAHIFFFKSSLSFEWFVVSTISIIGSFLKKPQLLLGIGLSNHGTSLLAH